MNTIHLRTCALAAVLPLFVSTHAAPIDLSNAEARVSPAQYDFASKSYRPARADSAGTDKAWRAANDAVVAKPGEDRVMGTQMGGSMSLPTQGKSGIPASTDKAMVMPDDATIPPDRHKSIPMDGDMKMPAPKGDKLIPTQKGLNTPRDKGIKMPDGRTMPLHKNMKIPRSIPKGDTSMPWMDMPHGRHDSEH